MDLSSTKTKKLIASLIGLLIALAFFIIGYFVGQSHTGYMRHGQFPNGYPQGFGGNVPGGMRPGMRGMATGTPMQAPAQGVPAQQ